MTNDNGIFQYALSLGDNSLILGQRLSEWCGHAPVLEEDIAITNIALDLIGQARLWLSCAAEIEGKGRDEDQLAFLRDAQDFRNVLLVEQPNGDFAETLARQFYFDAWHYLLLEGLSRSSDPRFADISGKALKEVTYHLQRSSDWVLRLGDGTDESHARMQAAIDGLWMYTGELFEMGDNEKALAERGIACDVQQLHEPWLNLVQDVLSDATLQMPSAGWMQRGGRDGRHTEHLGHMLAEMQFLQRAYPGAQW